MAAETILSCVVGKLADAVVNEVLFLHGVGGKVESMKRELERMQCFLKDADKKRKGDARVQGWVNDVRGAAFRIEDAIDTFIAEIARINCRNIIKRTLTKPAKIIAQHKLGKELDAINLLIAEISKSRITYGINNLGEGNGSEVEQPVRPIVIPDIDETEVVGFKADKEFIIGQLLDPNNIRRSVVSIVGQGGLGKTTLAVKAYKSLEVPKHFDIKIWVAVSKDFTLTDLVKKMLHQANLSWDEKETLDDLIIKLNIFLKEKKYVVVLDDVWTSDLWTQIEVVFPDVKNSSRVLMTSRFFDVAKIADPINEPHKLPFLNENDSRNLFLKYALFGKELPSDLNDLSTEFLKKCGGLPLALVVLGRFLSIKPLTFQYWSELLEQMKWSDVGKNCMEIIGTSYEDLPPVLKSCFMYFASFPEDHKIKAKSLIRMWVAEGFIPEKKHRTMEEIAHDYLENLVERSMVQVAKRNYNGSIKYCRMHDLLRDLAIQKAEEDNFLMVFPNGDSHNGSDKARRVAVHYHNCEQLIKATNPNVRSLLCFSGGRNRNCSRFRLLRVFNNYESKFEDFMQLTQLRCFLQSGYYAHHFRQFATHNKSLQTIDLSSLSSDFFLPNCFWDIKTLRHVILPNNCGFGPSSSADLKNLQTLRDVSVQKSWYKGLPYLPNLRELRVNIDQDREYGCEIVAKLLTNLEHLVHLEIISFGRIYMFEMKTFSCYEYMQILRLKGPLFLGKLAFDVSIFPVNLIDLKLTSSSLEEDPMPILGKLKNLKKLELYEGAYNGNKMTCLAGDFFQLKTLTISIHPNLSELKIENGSLPVFHKFSVIWCDKLEFDGLHHITTLKTFIWLWRERDEEITSRREIIMRSQLKHVPSVTFTKREWLTKIIK